MSDPQELKLEQAVRDLIVDLCEVLYRHGYQEISVGALMRVIGVDPDKAATHDTHVIDLHEHFDETNPRPPNIQIPPGTVFH